MISFLISILLLVNLDKFSSVTFFNTTKRSNGDGKDLSGNDHSTFSTIKSKFYDLFNTEHINDYLPQVNTLVPYNMMLDIKETDNNFELIVDLPGVDKKNIHVGINKNHLTITADRNTSNECEGHNCQRAERYTGRITRSVHLPDSVQQSEIHANVENGVLKVSLLKPPHQLSESMSVEVK
jgi:HSP20 family protein